MLTTLMIALCGLLPQGAQEVPPKPAVPQIEEPKPASVPLLDGLPLLGDLFKRKATWPEPAPPIPPQDPPKEPPQDFKKMIDKSMADLADEDFKVREAAMESLRSYQAYIQKVIKKGAGSTDPEVAARARKLLGGRSRAPVTNPGLPLNPFRDDGTRSSKGPSEEWWRAYDARDAARRRTTVADAARAALKAAAARAEQGVTQVEAVQNVQDWIYRDPLRARPSPQGIESLSSLRADLTALRRRFATLEQQNSALWKAVGFAAEPVDEALRAQLDLSDGLVVRRVGKAGWDVNVNDIILGYRTAEALHTAITGETPPESITVLRKGTKTEVHPRAQRKVDPRGLPPKRR